MAGIHRFPLHLSAEQYAEVRSWYDDYDGYSDELDDEDWVTAEPEAIPLPTDHDQRVDDYYSQQQGDVSDNDLPPF